MSEPDERFQELVERVRVTRIGNRQAQQAVEEAETQLMHASASMADAWEDLQKHVESTIDEPMTLMAERLRQARGIGG